MHVRRRLYPDETRSIEGAIEHILNDDERAVIRILAVLVDQSPDPLRLLNDAGYDTWVQCDE